MQVQLAKVLKSSVVACVCVLAGCGGGGGSDTVVATSNPTGAPSVTGTSDPRSGTAGTGTVTEPSPAATEPGLPGEGGPSSPGSSTSLNQAPRIQGTPGASVVVGQTYRFQPVATDANGDTLTFAATNLPPWLALDSGTGSISGTPTLADVATYTGIALTVSDGTDSSALEAFSIDVIAVGGSGGAVPLVWVAPTTNTDGSALTNLAGYRVMYGRSATELNQVITLSNASLNVYVVENLSAGTWYFAVVAVNSSGAESRPSNIATKTI